MAPISLKISLHRIFTFSMSMILKVIFMLFLLGPTTDSAIPLRPTAAAASVRNRNPIYNEFQFNPRSWEYQERNDWDLEALRLWRRRSRHRLAYDPRDEFRGRKVTQQSPRLAIDWFLKPQTPKPNRNGAGGRKEKDRRNGKRREKSHQRNEKPKVVKKSDPGLDLDELDYDQCCPVVKEVVSPGSGRNSTGHLVELYQDDRIQQKFYEVSCRDDIINQPCKFFENTKRPNLLTKCKQQHTLTYALVRPHINQTAALASAGSNDQGLLLSSSNNNVGKNAQDIYHWSTTEIPLENQSNLIIPEKKSIGFITNIYAAMMSNGAEIKQPWYLDYITIRSGCACQVVNSRRKKKAWKHLE